jgi:hypothetical protein
VLQLKKQHVLEKEMQQRQREKDAKTNKISFQRLSAYSLVRNFA